MSSTESETDSISVGVRNYGSVASRVAPDGSQGHSLLVDGKTVKTALTRCPRLFRELSTECLAVIGCRLAPMQKALVVRLVKRGPPASGPWLWQQPRKPITLAIGDGANDVAMIQEAHVGVAILGHEGRQAARASDYAFGQFRFLARLILVHGHWCYNRIAYTLQYFFYKDVVFILPALFFGFYSAFSAEPIYDSWTLLFWNLAFSALPILIFGTFEKDMDANMLLAYSGLHKALARNAMLTFREFGLWTILGIWQAIVAFFGVILCFSDDGVLTLGLMEFGNVVFFFVFMFCLIRIMLDFRDYTVITGVAIVLTVVAYVGFMLIYTGIPDVFGASSTTGGIYWTFYHMLGSARFWLACPLLLALGSMSDFAISYAKRVIRPTPLQLVQHKVWQARASRPRAGNYEEEDHSEVRPLLRG